MRYDTPIFFQRITHGEYDPATGNYEPDQAIETKVWANKTDAGVETLNLIYGQLKQGALVIRLQSHYTEICDCIRIENKLYKVDFSRKLKTKHVFVVSEVQ